MGQQQFKVGDQGKTRGGLKYRVAGVDDSDQTVRSIITLRNGEKLSFWHKPDGRVNVSDLPDYWLVPPATAFFARIVAAFARLGRAA